MCSYLLLVSKYLLATWGLSSLYQRFVRGGFGTLLQLIKVRIHHQGHFFCISYFHERLHNPFHNLIKLFCKYACGAHIIFHICHDYIWTLTATKFLFLRNPSLNSLFLTLENYIPPTTHRPNITILQDCTIFSQETICY